MDYVYQFIVGLSATAIGVFLGLILDKKREHTKLANEADEIEEKIRIEIVDAIHTISTTRNRKDNLFLSPIKTPVFKAYVNSAKITLLDKHVWYEDLLNLYKDIDDFNAWHNLKTDKTFDKDAVMLEKIDDGLRAVEKLITKSNVLNALKIHEKL